MRQKSTLVTKERTLTQAAELLQQKRTLIQSKTGERVVVLSGQTVLSITLHVIRKMISFALKCGMVSALSKKSKLEMLLIQKLAEMFLINTTCLSRQKLKLQLIAQTSVLV
jgi:hypothetical protein